MSQPTTAAAPRWARVWKGRTRPALFEEYAAYLYAEGVRKIAAIPGNLGVEMVRRRAEDFAEFVVTSYWPDLETIKRFAGEDITLTRHLPRDPEYLLEMPRNVEHFEIYVRDAEPGPG